MNRRRILWLTLALGGIIEGALCGLAAMFGSFGPCGPGNNITGLLFVLHIPSISVAEVLLPQNTLLELPVVILVSAALWSVVALVVISCFRRVCDRVKKPMP
jgi:hypothetical protein